MNVYILAHTDRNIAYECCKAFVALSKKTKDFKVVFDKEYDLLYELPELVGKIYFKNMNNVIDIFKNNNLVLLDFDLDWYLHGNEFYSEYIKEKILGSSDVKLPKINLQSNSVMDNKIKNIIQENDVHNYSNVFLGNVPSEIKPMILDFLQPRVNLIEKTEEMTTSEVYHLIRNCSFCISKPGFEQLIASDNLVPNFVIVDHANASINQQKNCYIYDPYKNDYFKFVPSFFERDYNHRLLANKQIFNIEQVQKSLFAELLDAFNNEKLPFVND